MLLKRLFCSRKKAGAPDNRIIYDHTYTHSSGFRGFKRIALTTYKDSAVNSGIRALKRLNPNSDPFCANWRNVRLVVGINNTWATTPVRYMDVFVDGCIVGRYFDYDHDDIIDYISSNMIDKVHVEIEDLGEKYRSRLFVHIAE